MAITYEKLLEKLLRAAEALPEDGRELFNYYDNRRGEFQEKHYCLNSYTMLAGIAADLREAIAEQAAKSAGHGNARKAAQRIFKAAPRDDCRQAWEQDGKQILCNGYLAIALNTPIGDLPTTETLPFDALRCIKAAADNNGAVLPVPTAAELRGYIKQRTAEMKARGLKESFPLYDFGNDLPAVNARYLLDCVEILPGAVFRASSHRPEVCGIYFESADGCGILLPVRRADAEKSA